MLISTVLHSWFLSVFGSPHSEDLPGFHSCAGHSLYVVLSHKTHLWLVLLLSGGLQTNTTLIVDIVNLTGSRRQASGYACEGTIRLIEVGRSTLQVSGSIGFGAWAAWKEKANCIPAFIALFLTVEAVVISCLSFCHLVCPSMVDWTLTVSQSKLLLHLSWFCQIIMATRKVTHFHVSPVMPYYPKTSWRKFLHRALAKRGEYEYVLTAFSDAIFETNSL